MARDAGYPAPQTKLEVKVNDLGFNSRYLFAAKAQRNPTAELHTRTVLHHQGTKDSAKDNLTSPSPRARFCSSSCPW